MGEQSERISTARLSQGFCIYKNIHCTFHKDNDIFQYVKTYDDLLPIS